MQETILFCLPAFQICFVSSNRICRKDRMNHYPQKRPVENGRILRGRVAGGGEGIANWELEIANCKLRISGLRPGVIYFACKNWAETPLAFKPAGRNPHSGNANGVPSFSPGLRGTSYPGNRATNRNNPNGVASRVPNPAPSERMEPRRGS